MCPVYYAHRETPAAGPSLARHERYSLLKRSYELLVVSEHASRELCLGNRCSYLRRDRYATLVGIRGEVTPIARSRLLEGFSEP